jgi:hypothetical protein
MKRVILFILFLGICASQSLQARTSNESTQLAIGISASFGNVGFFYNALSPYGEWLELETGFHVWRPQHIRSGWRPYLYGRWRWTDYGWYWVSSEPFGWAVFHYGRWFRDDYYGWVWVPDRVWGPSWVEWRYDDDYIGWAPLPPYASFSFSIGIRFTTHWIAPIHYWSFVRHRHFNSPYIAREVVPVDYTRRLIRTTRSAGRYEVEGDRIINRGVDRSFIERRGNTRINRVDVREATERGERIIRDRSRERIEVYRPNRSELERSPERIDARRAERGTSLDLGELSARVEKARAPSIEVKASAGLVGMSLERDLKTAPSNVLIWNAARSNDRVGRAGVMRALSNGERHANCRSLSPGLLSDETGKLSDAKRSGILFRGGSRRIDNRNAGKRHGNRLRNNNDGK